jgi:hypothetical protein
MNLLVTNAKVIVYVFKHKKVIRPDSILVSGKAVWVRKKKFEDTDVERDSITKITGYSLNKLGDR